MDDLISRQAAIEMAEQIIDGNASGKAWAILCELKKIPPAEPYTEEEIQKMQELEQTQLQTAYELGKQDAQTEQQWIPCSERLPEEYGEYLITWTTLQSKRQFIAICECEITNEYNYEHERFECEWLLDDYMTNYPDVKVIAWMQLPQPYKGKEELHENK